MSNRKLNLILRKVVQQIVSIEQSEGVGGRVRRSIGTSRLRNLDPFLMLDEFHIQYPGGFPDHPHRGFETVSYIFTGTNQHEDFIGNQGIIGPGDLQWMTAGKGIVHAEMPLPQTKGPVTGLQLWINLPKKEKMCEPRYQDFKDNEIPRVIPEVGVEIKVIAGEAYGTQSSIKTSNSVYMMDFKMEANKSAYQILPAGFNSAFIYTIKGQVEVAQNGKLVLPHTIVVFDKEGGDEVSQILINSHNEKVHFVLIAGKPINEPIKQYGPFVMNDQEDINNAFLDYQFNKNGFEKAKNWKSIIGRRTFI
ncbi:hypothetical protein K502DRAFT_356624 [Neoconidiobolus thromboides FSU 785]|nr:hypothetical protein K502DRAFT_343921 [Neoconidiobolus thromboides FSU 785]KAI9297632.1 hypothetical protein K502DRAFT_356624 [Neoconidiobolus thromboides FSU 785]